MSVQNVLSREPAPGARRSCPGRRPVLTGLAACALVTFPAQLAQAAATAPVPVPVPVPVPCSVPALIDAIKAANSTPAPDSLRLTARCTYRLVAPDSTDPANGLPVITSDITIDGRGATIARAENAPAFRILLVSGTGALTLNKTTISGGRATDCPGAPVPPNPPGLVCGGGLNNQGTLRVNGSRVVRNTATSDVFAEGGGIDNDGTAIVSDTDLSGNSVEYTGTGQGGGAAGGGIASDGPLTVRHIRVFDNSVRVTANTDSFAIGAGIAGFAKSTVTNSLIGQNLSSAPGGTARGALTSALEMVVTGTTIRDNTAGAAGGTVTGGGVAFTGTMLMTRTLVLRNFATATGGNALGGGIRIGVGGAQLTLRDSTVADNVVRAFAGSAVGGGIDNSAGGTLTTERSAIFKNTAKAPNGGTARGGGLFNATGSATLNRSTVSRNEAGDGGGVFEESGTVTLNRSLVTRNRPNNCAPPGSVEGCTESPYRDAGAQPSQVAPETAADEQRRAHT